MTFDAREVQTALARYSAGDSSLSPKEQEDLLNGYTPDWIWSGFWGGSKGELEGLGSFKVVEDFGGEGQGDQRYLVFEITDDSGNKRYFRIDGYYASYDGSSWDGSELFEVRPVERVVTFYE